MGTCGGLSGASPHSQPVVQLGKSWRSASPTPPGFTRDWRALTQHHRPSARNCAEAQYHAKRWADEFFSWLHDPTLLDSLQHNDTDDRFRLLPPVYKAPCLRRYGQDDMDNTKFLVDLAYLDGGDDEACHIVSIGGNMQVSFEEELLLSTPCKVYQFDCSVSAESMQPIMAKMQHADRFEFGSTCVGVDGARVAFQYGSRKVESTLLSMSSLLHKYGIPRVDVLKFDAEGAEHDVLPDMLDDAALHGLHLPGQISVEVHMLMRSPQETLKALRVFQALFKAGYVLISQDFNPWGRHCCMEFTFALGCEVASYSSCAETGAGTDL